MNDTEKQLLDEQRRLLFQVMGILSCIRHAVGNDTPIDEPDVPRALDAAEAILNNVAGALEQVQHP